MDLASGHSPVKLLFCIFTHSVWSETKNKKILLIFIISPVLFPHSFEAFYNFYLTVAINVGQYKIGETWLDYKL